MSRNTPRLLFVTYGGGHVDIVLKLLPWLEKIPGIEFSVLSLTNAGQRMAQAGYPNHGCLHYLPRPGYGQAMSIGAELSEGFWDESSSVSWEESCAYLGVSMLDLITELGEVEARRRYDTQGRAGFCPVGFLTEVLRQEQAQLVVTTCHVRMERAAVLAARRLGIHSVRLEDLFGYSLLGEYGVGRAPQLLPEAEWPDEVVVVNSEVKRRLVESGFPAPRVHPLGQPVLSEWLASYCECTPSDALADWHDEGRVIITYATPARREVLYEQVDALLAVAACHQEWGVCIKLHPSVGRGEFAARYPVLPHNLRVVAEEDILPVVKASDLVVIFRSTVGLLCLSAGVPLLVIDSTGEPEVLPYVSSGAARGVDNLDRLEEVLVEMLLQGEGRVLPATPLFDIPSGASQRIAEWLVVCAQQAGEG